MQAHLRLTAAPARASRLIATQSRLLSTPPTGLRPHPPAPSGAAPVRPVVVSTLNPPVSPGSSSLPPPPPPPIGSVIGGNPGPGSSPGTLPPPPPPPPPGGRPGPKKRGFFRRFFIYTTVGVLVFYPLSGWASTQSETYREFFVETFPGAEWVADQFEGNATYGAAPTSVGGAPKSKSTSPSGALESVQQKAAEGWKKVTGAVTGEPSPPLTQAQKIEQAAKDARAAAESKAHDVRVVAEQKAGEAKKAVQSASLSAQKKAEEAKGAAKAAADKAEREVSGLANRAAQATQDAADKAKSVARDAKDKVVGAVSQAPAEARKRTEEAKEGVRGVAKSAEGALQRGEQKVENALHRGEQKVQDAAKATKDALTPASAAISAGASPRVLPDTQRPRELRPETVSPAKPTYEGQQKYSGPELPIGFEPPPGYYIPAPAKPVGAKTSESFPKPEPLPLLAPKVKDFGTDEPIISQLASTIDSLASSLSAPAQGAAAGAGAAAKGVLSKAQADLAALSARLADVKKSEKAKLERALADKTREFEATLKRAEESAEGKEKGLQDKWVKDRQGMVDEWKKKMEGELESQREGIEKRLREEVVSQGIELQRRWLRSIKTQVETERGGRLAKLDTLSTSLKELERITLDNSATLDDNVRLHKVWSALRAVQAKADAGDAAFTDELRVLSSLATPTPTPSDKSDTKTQSDAPDVASAALAALAASGVANTGIKSLPALSAWFSSSVSPRIHAASLVPEPEHAGVASHVASQVLSTLMFRPRAGPVAGGDVDAVLARAEWCLAEKDLDGAAREVNALKGWAGRLAADWLREARRTLEVRQALEVVATEATLGSLLLV